MLKCKTFNVALMKNVSNCKISFTRFSQSNFTKLDNLERALAVEGLTDDVKKGLEMTRDSLIRALNEEGVEEVVVENFDHNLHMAVQTLPADEGHPADSIAQVLQKGYKLHERLLRPAMVVVYS